MNTPQNLNLAVKRGDSFGADIEFTEDGEPLNITGWTLFLTIKTNIDDPDGSAVIAVTITSHVDAANGITYIEASAAAVNSLIGNYYYDIQYKDNSGRIKTIISGVVTFDKDVTRRTS